MPNHHYEEAKDFTSIFAIEKGIIDQIIQNVPTKMRAKVHVLD